MDFVIDTELDVSAFSECDKGPLSDDIPPV